MEYLPPYAGTVLGWAIVVGAGGALYLYYTGDSRRRPVRARASRAISNTNTEPQRVRAERRTTGQSSASAANSGGATSRSNKTKSESSAAKSTKSPSSFTHESTRDEEEDDNKAWAKDLAKAQQGYSFKASDSSRQQSRQKTVKQSSANRVAAELSGDSSTAGADVEARSPDQSPDLTASRTEAPTSGNVDDMLETAEDGPSVLRLTEPERFLPVKQKPAPKAPEQAETKKQRQNKKKAEERKQQQEELEKVRKTQLESQRRTAREARGEPAKNGMASAAASSAWTANVPKKETPVVNGNPLLDTFITDKVTTTDAPSKEAALHPQPRQAQKSAVPSEEEQMRILMEEDDSAWKTVGTKKAKSKRKDGEEIDDGAVKPVNQAISAPPAGKPLKSNGAYSVLSSDDDDGWTQA